MSAMSVIEKYYRLGDLNRNLSLEVNGQGVNGQHLLGSQVDPLVVVIWSSFCPALCVLPLLERTAVTLYHTLLPHPILT